MVLRAPASLQCQVGGASVARSARLAVPPCWQCSKGSAALSLPQRCPGALHCWRGGSPASPQCPTALRWWRGAVPSLQAVPCSPAVLDRQHPWSAPCSCRAGQAAVLHSCSALCPQSDGCCCSCSAGSDGWEGAVCWQCPVSLQCWVHGSPACLQRSMALHPCMDGSPASLQCHVSLGWCQPCINSMSHVPVVLDGCQPHNPAEQNGCQPHIPQSRQSSPFGAPVSAALAAACSARVSLPCVAGSAPALVAHNAPVFGW